MKKCMEKVALGLLLITVTLQMQANETNGTNELPPLSQTAPQSAEASVNQPPRVKRTSGPARGRSFAAQAPAVPSKTNDTSGHKEEPNIGQEIGGEASQSFSRWLARWWIGD